MLESFIKKNFFLVLSISMITQIYCDETRFKTHVHEGKPENWYDDFDPSPFIKVGLKYYLISNETVSWYKAAHLCRQHNANLASIRNSNEKSNLSTYLSRYWIGRWFWLSGIHLNSSVSIIWFGTGEKTDFTDIDRWSTEKNADCVDIRYEDGKWVVCNKICKNKAYYICEKSPPTTISFSIW